MKHYSQKDTRWAAHRLGTCVDTLAQSGCYITALAMLRGIQPDEVNDLLRDNGGYDKGCLLNSERSSKLLGLKYDGKTTEKPDMVCIAETDHYKSKKVPQHFFVYLPLGVGEMMIDPLDRPDEIALKPLKYKVKTYRLFHEYKLPGVGDWWGGEFPEELATRKDAIGNALAQFEKYFVEKYNLAETSQKPPETSQSLASEKLDPKKDTKKTSKPKSNKKK